MPGLPGVLAEVNTLLVQIIEVISAATFWIVTKFSFHQALLCLLPHPIVETELQI